MKKTLITALCLTLLLSLSLSLPARATVGRDILLVFRQINHWTGADTITTLEADGSRHVFDLRTLPPEVRNNQEELLFFLRTHGLTDDALLYDAPAPESLDPLPEELALQARALLGQVKEVDFEKQFFAFDAGAFLTYAVIQVKGEGQLTLLSEGGTYRGQTDDPGALELIKLVGPYLMFE